mmetsp:Transcript_26105/g.57519  ORF Transcript_26105/g.57519 Transcript_26105/m.57519 type:complete len:212 (+) Transcript_26105:94-729(+)
MSVLQPFEQIVQKVHSSAQETLEYAQMSPAQATRMFCHDRHPCGNSFINLVPSEMHSSIPRRKSILSFIGFFDSGDDLHSLREQGRGQSKATTVMLQNLPRPCTRKKLMFELDDAGFSGTYDFCHVPADYSTGVCLGYAFVNFRTCDAAEECLNKLHGSERFCIKKHRKPLMASWAHIQGFDALCQQTRRACRARKAEFRPFILADGPLIA